MYIYRGKLNFSTSDSQSAMNEAITIIFPSEFRLGDPVYTCWQWSILENKNTPCWLTGTIDLVANFDVGGNKIGFYGGSDCRFDGFFSRSSGIEELSIMVRFGNVLGTATNTKLVFKPDSGSVNPGVIVPRIYLGRLVNWPPHSTDQTLLVVIPGRIVGEGNSICAYWQWTVIGNGERKANVDITPGRMTNVLKVVGSVLFSFTNGYYTFHATMNSEETAERQQLILEMKNPANKSTGSLTLELQDLRPSPSGRQLRAVNDSTTVDISDNNAIAGGSQNEESSLMRSIVEMGLKIVELTNTLNEKFNGSEQVVRDRDSTIAQLESELRVAQLESQLRIAQLESQLRVAQLESQLQASQFENKLLGTKLLETERAREEDRFLAQETKDKL